MRVEVWTFASKAPKASQIFYFLRLAGSRPVLLSTVFGDFVGILTECLVNSAKLAYPKKKEAFQNVPFSGWTVKRPIKDILGNFELQLKNKAISADFFSPLALEERGIIYDACRNSQFLICKNAIRKEFDITDPVSWLKGTTTGLTEVIYSQK